MKSSSTHFPKPFIAFCGSKAPSMNHALRERDFLHFIDHSAPTMQPVHTEDTRSGLTAKANTKVYHCYYQYSSKEAHSQSGAKPESNSSSGQPAKQLYRAYYGRCCNFVTFDCTLIDLLLLIIYVPQNNRNVNLMVQSWTESWPSKSTIVKSV